jgi:polysaccharide deacetylase family protein (PEP-CTERM system associated)
MMLSSAVINALSVDVEEYYHAVIFREGTRGNPSRECQSRVEASVDRILTLLGESNTLATFFILGEIADRHPAMVRRIDQAGHEVACHSYHHDLVSGQNPIQFRSDVRRAKVLLEDIIGKPVIGYRAPNFSIGRGQAWALDILLEEGFRYDSSIYPILHDRYGDPSAPRFPHEIRRNGYGGLIEVPIGTMRVLGVNLPAGGGGYFRLLPLGFMRGGIKRVNARDGHPIVFYFHPWELDPDQPRPPMPWHHRFRHYVGLHRTESKLSRLLREFRFSTIRHLLGIL